jgi:putative transposase
MNRAVRRTILFKTERDYRAFLNLARQAVLKFKVKVISFSLMPNHWHFVIICDRLEELSRCMHWLESTHANRWNGAHRCRGSGAVYKDRFKAVPVQSNESVRRVCRYVERNALRKGLVTRAELWEWSSLHAVCQNCSVIPLTEWPIMRPDDWIEVVNAPETEAELADLRRMIRCNQPIGDPAWQEAVAPYVGLTMRGRGRPKKKKWTRPLSEL